MSNRRLREIVEILETNEDLYKMFRFNEMSRMIEIDATKLWGKKGNLNDSDVIHLKFYLSKTKMEEYPVNIINEAIVIVSQRMKYNPLLNYLNNLEWDKKPRLETWLPEICGTEDNEYTREVGLKIVCAAVKRAYEPGCKFDHMLILEGSQGIGKSTLVDILGGEWYLDTSLTGSENKKDLVDSMRTAWIIEISDLAGFKRSDVEYLKHFLSDREDRVRLPYAKHSEDFPRNCIFIGTHNPSGDNQYFRDDTGNRRFWCVECGNIDLNKIKDCRDQLFAEAVAKYKDVRLYIESKGSHLILNALHKSREMSTPLEEMISEYLMGKNVVNNKDIMEKVFRQNPGQLSYRELIAKTSIIGRHMKKEGWVRGENKRRGWYFREGHEYEKLTDDGWE